MNPDLVREVGITLSALVLGAGSVALARYWQSWRDQPKGSKERTSVALAAWTCFALMLFALNQAVARAFMILSGNPLDWKDWSTIIIQGNALALLYAIIRYEGKR